MPVNTYITANGRIRRRITTKEAGIVTDDIAVVTNALGSVVATYKDGWLTADRSYDPYGETRAEWNDVGRFGWVGGLGYRETRREWVSHYVRARHYGFPMGMWTSVDPLWPSEPAFGYVGGRSNLNTDPSGTCAQNPQRLHSALKIKGICKQIKAAARKYGIPCNLLATTLFLEAPIGLQAMADGLWQARGGKQSVGVPQITIYPGKIGKWSLENVYYRIKDRECCQDIRRRWSELECRSFPLQRDRMMRECVMSCLYRDSQLFTELAADHLRDDCLSFLSRLIDRSAGIRDMDLIDLAGCANQYNMGGVTDIRNKDRERRIRASARGRDFLDCYDYVNSLCCGDVKPRIRFGSTMRQGASGSKPRRG